jgi:hypothetical protein
VSRAIEVMQANIAERIQQIQQQHPDMQQRYFQTHLSQERRKMQTKTNAPEETFKAAIQQDEGRKKQKDGRNRQEAAPDTHSEDSGGQEQQSHIDIEV